MKKLLYLVFCLSVSFSSLLMAEENKSVFREPFTLELKYSETESESIEVSNPVPYSHEGAVYLFRGESFGVKLKDGADFMMAEYVTDPANADLVFKFEQDSNSKLGIGMILTTENRLQKAVSFKTVFTVLGAQQIFQLPVDGVKPGESHTQTWEHPLVQLVLMEFAVS